MRFQSTQQKIFQNFHIKKSPNPSIKTPFFFLPFSLFLSVALYYSSCTGTAMYWPTLPETNRYAVPSRSFLRALHTGYCVFIAGTISCNGSIPTNKNYGLNIISCLLNFAARGHIYIMCYKFTK